MEAKDEDFLKEIDVQMDSARRNAKQGDMGRALAMTKLAEAKNQLSQMKSNFEQESVKLISSGNTEDGQAPVFSLAAKKDNVHKLEAKAKVIKAKLPELHQLEVDLGLPEDVKDQDLVQVAKALDKSIEDAKKQVRSEEVAEAQAIEDAKPKEKFTFQVPNE